VFKTIVLGVDGSDGSKRAVPLATEAADLMMVGTRGHSALPGIVAQPLVHLAHQPVLTIPPLA
jgi:nucleotide-binding universal stress UspA family protein